LDHVRAGHVQHGSRDWHIDVIELDPSDKSKSVAELFDALEG